MFIFEKKRTRHDEKNESTLYIYIYIESKSLYRFVSLKRAQHFSDQ